MQDAEHRLQCACVRWFRYQYPHHASLLFAVPNGGRRDAVTGARLKAEGVVAGVADLLLFVPTKQHGAKEMAATRRTAGIPIRGDKRFPRIRTADQGLFGQ